MVVRKQSVFLRFVSAAGLAFTYCAFVFFGFRRTMRGCGGISPAPGATHTGPRWQRALPLLSPSPAFESVGGVGCIHRWTALWLGMPARRPRDRCVVPPYPARRGWHVLAPPPQNASVADFLLLNAQGDIPDILGSIEAGGADLGPALRHIDVRTSTAREVSRWCVASAA